MNHYESLNFMNEDQLLSSDEIMIRDSVRDMLNQEAIPLLQKCHREETFPEHLIPAFGKMGLLGSTIKGYGCPGLGDIAYGLIMMELERADSGLRSFCSVQGALVMYPISTFGTEEQKQEYLPKLASGEWIGCFGLTEPDAGSNPGALRTTAKRVPGGYLLNGSKMWITNGSIADIAVIWARLDDHIQGFLVKSSNPGYHSSPLRGKFSLRISVTSEISLQDCFVHDQDLLPKARGLKSALSCLSQARYGIGWGVIGSANECYSVALKYAKERLLFDGKPLSHYQLAQAKLVRMVQSITKAKLLAIQAGRLKEKGEFGHHHISLLKLNNCRMALDIARDARDMLGASGIVDEYPIIRHMMNLESVNTYEGTEDVHRLVVGQAITEAPAFR